MPYLGRYRLGDTVLLPLVTADANGTPTLPVRAPTVEVFSSSAQVANLPMPINDRYGVTAFFLLPVRLTSSYAAGPYRATYNWNLAGGYQGFQEDTFEVLAGGHADGVVQSMFWAEFPHAKFLMHHLESGTVVFGRNPRV